MKPKEYVEVCKKLAYIRTYLTTLEEFCYANVELPSKEEVRPATPEDVVPSKLFFYFHGGMDEKGFWQIVDTVHHPNDSFKAYTANDGCRYGLDGAFVYKKGR